MKKRLEKRLNLLYNNIRSADKGTQIFAPLAHLVEHLTLNQGVQGSSPWRRTRVPVWALNCLGWYFSFVRKQ